MPATRVRSISSFGAIAEPSNTVPPGKESKLRHNAEGLIYRRSLGDEDPKERESGNGPRHGLPLFLERSQVVTSDMGHPFLSDVGVSSPRESEPSQLDTSDAVSLSLSDTPSGRLKKDQLLLDSKLISTGFTTHQSSIFVRIPKIIK